MKKVTDSQQPEYLVYIISGKANKMITGISEKESFLLTDKLNKFVKLIYFECFKDRTKAMRKKSRFDKLSDQERLKLIKKKNPELLNLIFSIKDNYSQINFLNNF